MNWNRVRRAVLGRLIAFVLLAGFVWRSLLDWGFGPRCICGTRVHPEGLRAHLDYGHAGDPE